MCVAIDEAVQVASAALSATSDPQSMTSMPRPSGTLLDRLKRLRDVTLQHHVSAGI